MLSFKKILLLGSQGQIGCALNNLISQSSLIQITALCHSDIDIADTQAIQAVIHTIRPNLIINCAAYTAVDNAEREPQKAWATNAIAPKILAKEAKKINALFVHFSTDYVFDGEKMTPYTETDEPNPLNIYGKSKRAGEEAILNVAGNYLIFRTSWVYSQFGNSFFKKITKLAHEKKELSVVADQIGAPTSSHAIASATISTLLEWSPSKSGIYHMTNSGATSWYAFAQKIIEFTAQKNPNTPTAQIMPIAARDYPTLAKRPYNSRLDNSKLLETFSVSLPPWEESFLQTLQVSA